MLRIADFIEQFVERLRRESLACGQGPQYVYQEQANPENLGQRWIAGRSSAQLPEDHIAYPFARVQAPSAPANSAAPSSASTLCVTVAVTGNDAI